MKALQIKDLNPSEGKKPRKTNKSDRFSAQKSAINATRNPVEGWLALHTNPNLPDDEDWDEAN